MYTKFRKSWNGKSFNLLNFQEAAQNTLGILIEFVHVIHLPREREIVCFCYGVTYTWLDGCIHACMKADREACITVTCVHYCIFALNSLGCFLVDYIINSNRDKISIRIISFTNEVSTVSTTSLLHMSAVARLSFLSLLSHDVVLRAF